MTDENASWHSITISCPVGEDKSAYFQAHTPDPEVVALHEYAQQAGRDAIPTLCSTLWDTSKSDTLRSVAAMFLGLQIGRRGTRKALYTLIDAAKVETSDHLMGGILSALGNGCASTSKKALIRETLLNILSDDQWKGTYSRAMAAEMLGWEGNADCIQPLIDALNDPFTDVRFFAARGLGMRGDERAIPYLEHIAATDTGFFKAGDGGYICDEARTAIRKIHKRLARNIHQPKLRNLDPTRN